MKKGLKIVYTIAIISIAVVFMCFTGVYVHRNNQESVCRKIDISIGNEGGDIYITSGDVEQWLGEGGFHPLNERLDAIDTDSIEKALKSRDYVKKVQAYVAGTNTLHIEIEQRQPVLRLFLDDSLSIFLDSERVPLTVRGNFACDIPVVTCSGMKKQTPGVAVKKEAEIDNFLTENVHLFDNLLNFVKFIHSDTLWNALFVQINLDEQDEIELIPRVGNHTILMGDLSDYEQKLGKLEAFYKNEFHSPDFGGYKFINLKYSNQIVCAK